MTAYLNLRADMLCAAQHLVADKTEARVHLRTVRVEPHPDEGVLMIATDGHVMGIFHDVTGTCDAPRNILLPVTKAIRKLIDREDGTLKVYAVDETHASLVHLPLTQVTAGARVNPDLRVLSHVPVTEGVFNENLHWRWPLPKTEDLTCEEIPWVNPRLMSRIGEAVATLTGEDPCLRLVSTPGNKAMLVQSTTVLPACFVVMRMLPNEPPAIVMPPWLCQDST